MAGGAALDWRGRAEAVGEGLTKVIEIILRNAQGSSLISCGEAGAKERTKIYNSEAWSCEPISLSN